MSRNIPPKEMKLLCLQSGGTCAFLGCGKSLIQPGTLLDEPAVLGEIAHIVAYEEGGPRGAESMTEAERNKHTNLILLCGDHHKLIDSQPNTYSIPVLRQMKADHEAQIRRATTSNVAEAERQLKQETIHSSLLAVTHLPGAVFAAPCRFDDSQEAEVKQRILYPNERWELAPFLLREHKLLAFHNLRELNNPFSTVTNRPIEKLRATDLWCDAEGKRRYQTLLNRALYKYTSRLEINYDPIHRRFYFPTAEGRGERVVQYRPLNVAQVERSVAWQPKQKSTGEKRKFWWHLAAALKFHQVASDQWCLSIRPERHLTSDGYTPLPSNQIGRRVTRLKARMYNDLYLSEVNFWRDYLCQGKPQIILNFGNQSAVIDTQFLPFDIRWIGIPGDDKPFKNQVYENDLFSLYDLAQATEGEEIDWDEAEDEDTEEDEDDDEG